MGGRRGNNVTVIDGNPQRYCQPNCMGPCCVSNQGNYRQPQQYQNQNQQQYPQYQNPQNQNPQYQNPQNQNQPYLNQQTNQQKVQK